jgi:alanine racemase
VKISPVVKANAYGHGAIPLAKIAADLGCPYLCVAFLEEAIEIRKAGIQTPILVMNYFNPDTIPLFERFKVTATVYSFAQLDAITAYLEPNKLKVHLKIDTGMSRIGIRPEEVERLLSKLLSVKNVELEGMYTHFATADETDTGFAQKQYSSFLALKEQYRSSLRYFHISNSAAAQFLNWDLFDFIRLGIASYGLDPRNETRIRALYPVLSWETILSCVKTVHKGESISYGRTYTAGSEIVTGTIPVGYADGYNRLLSNRGSVLIQEKRCSILGRICMDQFMVDLTGIENPIIGDRVVLLGRYGNEEISAEEIARLSSTINYEVTCGISKRVQRVYKKKET